MSFWKDFAEGLKDVGTTTTRIVTDTAIDLGNVATGFQFNDDMEAAKKKMSDAGVLSPGDAIKKNHYPFLEEREKEARNKLVQVQDLFKEGQDLENERDALVSRLSDMCADVTLLSQASSAAETLLAEAQKIPEWEKWATILDIPPVTIAEVSRVSASAKQWQQVGQKIAMSSLIVGAADGTAALVTLAALSKAKRLTKLSNIARTSSAARTGTSAVVNTAAKSAKFLKVGKLAGRASGVLAIASVGLDIGLSVVELEQKNAQIKTVLAELDSDIAEANQDLSALRQEKTEILSRINELLASVEPPQTQGSWPNWVDATGDALKAAIDRLTSVSGIIEQAKKKAEQTRGKPLEQRIKHVVAIDPNISPEEARQIIETVDREAGYTEPQSTEQANFKPIASWVWQVEGTGNPVIMQNADLDQITCLYGLPEGYTSSDATWKYCTTADLTRTLSIQWSYGASHSSQHPFSKITLYADRPSGREVIALHEGIPPSMSALSQGSSSIQVHENCSFGIVVIAKAELENSPQASASPEENSELNMTLGTFTLQFSV